MSISWLVIGLLYPAVTYPRVNKIYKKNIRRLYEKKDDHYGEREGGTY